MPLITKRPMGTGLTNLTARNPREEIQTESFDGRRERSGRRRGITYEDTAMAHSRRHHPPKSGRHRHYSGANTVAGTWNERLDPQSLRAKATRQHWRSSGMASNQGQEVSARRACVHHHGEESRRFCKATMEGRWCVEVQAMQHKTNALSRVRSSGSHGQ